MNPRGGEYLTHCRVTIELPEDRSLRMSTIARWRDRSVVVDYVGSFEEWEFPNNILATGWEIGLGTLPLEFFKLNKPVDTANPQIFKPAYTAIGDERGMIMFLGINLLVPNSHTLALRIKYDQEQNPWIGRDSGSIPIFRQLSIEQIRHFANTGEMIDHI